MTKFYEELVYSFIRITKYHCLPITFGKDHLWVNIGQNSVAKVKDGKLIHSWTLRQPHVFTCPVIFNGAEEILSCIIDNNTLIEWSAAADTLQGAAKTEFQENVFCLLDVPEQKPVILFNSGKYVYSSDNSEPSGRTLFGEEEELIWADAATCESDLKVICVSYKKKTKQYKLHCLSLNKDDRNSTHYFHQVLSHNTADLKNWCLSKINSNFYTIWSDGVLLSHRTDNNIEATPVLLIPEIEENTLLAIVVIDSSHIAVAKAGSKSKEISLEIWDSKFSALKARKLLKATHFDYHQVSTVNSTAFLPSSEGLVAAAFHVEKSTLASVVGKSIAVSPNTKEFSWNEGKLVPASQISNTKNVDIVSEESSFDKTELLALR
ncbi:Nucleolar protein 11-like protein, partial [Stegodyphus mimosarum]